MLGRDGKNTLQRGDGEGIDFASPQMHIYIFYWRNYIIGF